MDRYENGLKMLQTVDGDHGVQVVQSLQGIAPDLGKYIIEFGFGDIYCRPGLNLKQRQMITVTALTVQGCCEPQLKVHINASLNVGLTPDEIIETIIHCTPYIGFPKVINAVKTAQQVFIDQGIYK